MTAPRRTSPGGRLGAFTLVEAMISMVVVAIILGAVSSLMLLTTRQVNATTGGSANLSKAALLSEQIAAELSVAKSVTERTAAAITLTVPDRNSDGQDETIRYAWSGVPGDPLTRKYNNGTPANVAENVCSFNLDYLLKTVAP
jgi:Tfp pilus assembly protein PilV